MKRILSAIAAGLLGLMMHPLVWAAAGDVIPRPSDVKEVPGEFTLTPQTEVLMSDITPDMKQTAGQLSELLGKPLGGNLKINTPDINERNPSQITLIQKELDPPLGEEGYSLSVHPDGVTIQAKTSTGLFYGMQTLRQLLPPEIEKRDKVDGVKWTIHCVEIKDSPRFAWRGLMLDVARHFEDKAEVESLLDLMALYKLNVFHWHLVDDQGWRIEIKKYPKLTEIGAWRDGIGFGLDPQRSTHYRKDGKYGGFYSQDDIRQVVAYAGKLHIMVVPEIEMPGHSQAALAAYPQYSCSKKDQPVGLKGGVMDAIYDAGDGAVFGFLDDVLSEVSGLFPGPYIHIGGDEVPKEPWKNSEECQNRIKVEGLKNEDELQSYFIKRVEKIIERKHKRLIGWDEILEGGLAPNATVMSWRGISAGITAAQQGHDVVMTPTSHLYLDHRQTRRVGEPPTIGGYLPLEKVYSYDPIPEGLTPEQARHVLGAQGNLWTEYMPNIKQVEHMAFPRACALAEIAWSPHDRLDFKDFLRRLDSDEKRMTVLGVNYCNDPDPGPIGQ